MLQQRIFLRNALLIQLSKAHQISLTSPRLGDPETVGVNNDALNDVITSLKDSDISALTSRERNEKLIKITKLFQKCIILPGHQLTTEDLERKIQPLIERTIADFYNQLPLNQEAFNQTAFEIMKAQLKAQERLIEHTQATHDAVLGLETKLTNPSNRYSNVSMPDAVTACCSCNRASSTN